MDEISLWLRLVNCFLGGIVAGLCFLKLENGNPDKARNARILGLGIISIAITIGSFSNRYEELNIRVPLLTVGLLCSYYGMRRMAVGEKPQYRQKRKSV